MAVGVGGDEAVRNDAKNERLVILCVSSDDVGVFIQLSVSVGA
jgi:hypothetical protein